MTSTITRRGTGLSLRHGCTFRRRNYDLRATPNGRVIDRDRVVSSVRREASDAVFHLIGQSEAYCGVIDVDPVNTCATITPEPSTPRWSFLQPRANGSRAVYTPSKTRA